MSSPPNRLSDPLRHPVDPNSSKGTVSAVIHRSVCRSRAELTQGRHNHYAVSPISTICRRQTGDESKSSKPGALKVRRQQNAGISGQGRRQESTGSRPRWNIYRKPAEGRCGLSSCRPRLDDAQPGQAWNGSSAPPSAARCPVQAGPARSAPTGRLGVEADLTNRLKLDNILPGLGSNCRARPAGPVFNVVQEAAIDTRFGRYRRRRRRAIDQGDRFDGSTERRPPHANFPTYSPSEGRQEHR